MAKYTYKKEFLGEWMRKEGITLAEIRRVLDIKGIDKLRMWTGAAPLPDIKNNDREDRGWMPLRHILKLCNYYPGLSLSSFIAGYEGEEPIQKTKQHRLERQTRADAMTIKRELEAKLEEQRSLMQQTIDAQKQTIASMQVTIDLQRDQLKMAHSGQSFMINDYSQPTVDRSSSPAKKG